MTNIYLEDLAAQARNYKSDPEAAKAAAYEIRKIVGPMTDDEEAHYFGTPAKPEPAPEASVKE